MKTTGIELIPVGKYLCEGKNGCRYRRNRKTESGAILTDAPVS